MDVAVDGSMARLLTATASMTCPLCDAWVTPADDSTWVLAWYDCPRCGHAWSARIRNGQPDRPRVASEWQDSLPAKERP
jgi:predicted RNA-binding Zn-ribbon protein involved in translation (DUF1610 family)